MMKKAVPENKIEVSKKPFAYATAKELWLYYAREKYSPLKKASDVKPYYDFIFASGAVGYWLRKEKKVPKDKNYLLFMSIYNNTKHFRLVIDPSKYPEYVISSQCLNKPIDNR